MISTPEFQQLTAEQRHQHIIDGLKYISVQYAGLAITTKKLNAWLNHLGLDPNDSDQIKEFIALSENCKANTDLLTSQMVVTSQKVSFVCDTLSKMLIQNIKQ